MNPVTWLTSFFSHLIGDIRAIGVLFARLPRLPKLRREVREMLAHGGLVVCTPAEGEQTFARTLIQLDGDAVTCFKADAAADPDKVKAHYGRVRGVLDDLECLPAVASGLAGLGATVAAVVMAGLYQMDRAEGFASFWQPLIWGWTKYGLISLALPWLFRRAAPKLLQWLMLRGRTPFPKPVADSVAKLNLF